MNNKKLTTDIKEGLIDVFLFDLDGTLYSSKAGIEFKIKSQMWQSLSYFLNVSVEEAHKIIWNSIQKYDNEVVALRKLSVDVEAFYHHVYSNLSIDTIKPYLNLDNTLERISLSKINLLLLTNSSKIHIKRVLESLNLSDVWKNTYSFEDMNYNRKPDKIVYKKIIQKEKITPSRTIYFDDSLPNLYTAHKLGFKTILVSNGLVKEPHFMELHYRVKHEVPEFVDNYTFDIVKTLQDLTSII